MLDHIRAIRSESARFLSAIETTPLTTPVPSCPGWTVADLAWHLTEVQEFWRKIAEDLRQSPDGMERLSRPDDSDLSSTLERESQLLVAALEHAEPAAACWSWHEGGGHVGWVMRRQAHEALIHRVDAQLAAGAVGSIDEHLAADGIDEILTVMLDATGLPEWAMFTPDGRQAALSITDGSRTWGLELGRFVGTSPVSGTSYDEAAVRLVAAPEEPDVLITGSAVHLDLWLWGRGPIERLTLEGSREVAESIREAALEATQ